MNADEFFGRYVARFGPFPCAVDNVFQMREWAPVIERIPETRVVEVFDAVGKARGKAKYLPRVDAFNEAMRALEMAPERPAGTCPHCYAGQLPVLAYRDTMGHWQVTDNPPAGFEPRQPANRGLHIVWASCSCEAGARVAPNRDKEKAARRVEWVVATKARYGFQSVFKGEGTNDIRSWILMLDEILSKIYAERHPLTPPNVYDPENPDDIPF